MEPPRKRIHPELLAQERQRILNFGLTELEVAPGYQLWTADLYNHYTRWLRDRNMKPSPLSIDGFGRMLPFEVQHRTIMHDGCLRRGIVGVKIKKS